MTADVELLPCGECGMPCRPGEYHPYAACLMFKTCRNSDTVRGNLQDAQDHATAAKDAEVEALRAEVERLAEALRLALDSHGVMLMTDPPQDAWKVRRVEEIGRALLRDQEEWK